MSEAPVLDPIFPVLLRKASVLVAIFDLLFLFA